jgi:tetratricopeptide (TPR) repeat protein
LKEQLPSDRPLSAVRVTAQGDEVVVHEGRTAWAPESGQRLLDFDVADLAREVAPLARRRAAEARTVEGELDADDWFELACDLEPCDPGQARDAYRRALEMEPNHVAARVNLGRLLHDAGQTRAAETHYRLALAADPANAIAAFNLGVALEDLGRPDEAVEAYEQALVADASLCDAHYNLSRLFERAGRASAAFRHLKAYKQLTDER